MVHLSGVWWAEVGGKTGGTAVIPREERKSSLFLCARVLCVWVFFFLFPSVARRGVVGEPRRGHLGGMCACVYRQRGGVNAVSTIDGTGSVAPALGLGSTSSPDPGWTVS